MRFLKPKILNITQAIFIICLVSLICSALLWGKRIFPESFQLGMQSPINLTTTEKTVVLDTEAIANAKRQAREEAIQRFLKFPPIERNDELNEKSLRDIKEIENAIDEFMKLQKEHKFINKSLSTQSQIILMLMPEKDFSKIIKIPGDHEDIFLKQLSDSFSETFWQELRNQENSIQKAKEEVVLHRKDWHNRFPEEISQKLIHLKIWNLDINSWKKIKPHLKPTTESILKHGYIGSLPEDTLNNILIAQSFKPSKEELSFLKSLFEINLQANHFIQMKSLKEIENKVSDSIEPIYKEMPAKSVIVGKGEIINQDELSIIEEMNLNKQEPNWSLLFESFGATLLVIISFIIYAKLEKYQLTFRQTYLLSFLIICASAFSGLLVFNMPTALPLAAIAMTIGLIFKPTVGFSTGTLFGVLCWQALEVSPAELFPPFMGIVAGTVLSQKAQNRADLARAGIWLGVIQIAAYLFITVVSKDILFSWREIWIHGLSGLGTAILVSSGMPYLESLFSVITRFRLQELSDSNQPLLKRLHDEAPGTYEHTLVVADLAQDAAKKIDADYELVRVGILYHDIGKLYNPQIFIENQFDGQDPHELMTPEESAKAIITHVTAGIEIAKKYRLPEAITHFIPAHQGNSRAGHFFLKACQADSNLKDDSAFRYPGPKANSKETGIAMLADTVEATIRSLKTDNKDLVKETISNLIEARIKDDQLSESTLTRRELDKIADSFYESWRNKNHERVKYISDLKK
jgi:putative nucleotidyltransferase with HDIG domain